MKNIVILSNATFEWSSLIPIVLMIAIAALIPILISVCRLKFLPVLVLEILSGIILASIPFTRDLFTVKTLEGYQFTSIPEGFYMVGMAALLFLSGLDTDFSVLHRRKKGDHDTIPVFRLSWILIGLVILLSIGGAFLFQPYFVNQDTKTIVVGITLLVIIFSSTFASVVIPLVHEEKLQNTTIGQIICTYSTIAEFMSIVSLSILMIALEMVNNAKPWLLLIVVGILLFIYIIERFVPKQIFKKSMEGIVHLDMRLIILVLLSLVILTQVSGAEFILGAFLAGMVIKSANVSKHTMEKVESVGYGIFVPLFYILVGLKIGLTMPINEFIQPENLLLIALVFFVLLLVKIPFLILLKWYKISSVIPTMFIVTCTIIVGIAGEHFGVFSERLASAIIIASSFTCLIPPVFFAMDKKYGYAKEKYDDIIINPNEVEEHGEMIENAINVESHEKF